MRKLFSLVIALLVCGAANSQVLFRVSGNGLDKPSYIFGTCHVVGGSFVDTIPGVKAALQESARVCGEVDMQYMQNPDTVAAMQSMIFMPGDSTLRDLLTEEQFSRLVMAVSVNLDLDLNQPQMAQLLRLRPLMFSITVAQLGEQAKAMKSGKPMQQDVIMDMYIQQQAAQQAKPVIGLETYAFQVKLLLEASDRMYSQQQQMENFIEGLSKLEESKKQVQELIDSYKGLDFAKIESVLQSQMKDSKDIENLILGQRNADWASKMPPIMKEQPTFFAVGFAHLAGNDSVLSLLKQQGYSVEAVK